MNKILALVFGVIVFGNIVQAASVEDALSAFRQYQNIEIQSISVPRVVDITHESSLVRPVVYNATRNIFEPSREFTTLYKVSLKTDDNNLTDGNYASYVDFPTNGFSMQDTEVVLQLAESTRVSGLQVSLPAYVAMPIHVSIRDTNGNILVAKKKMNSLTVNFPETETNGLIVTFSHIQPLRVSELSVVEAGALESSKHLRFLAQPDSEYRLYLDGDRYPAIDLGESANLSDNKDIIHGRLLAPSANVNFKQSDIDGDGVPDRKDNCVRIANSEQVDIDNNGRGDTCDDFDKDGVLNSVDNCKNQPNRYQKDEDADGIGDVCDGEESRLTEKYAWLEWAAMSIVALILLVLGGIVMRDMKRGGQ